MKMYGHEIAAHLPPFKDMPLSRAAIALRVDKHDYSSCSDEALRRAELMLKLEFNSTYAKNPAVELAKTPDYYARLQAIRGERKKRGVR